MKSLKLTVIALFFGALCINAQSKAIGLRFGGGSVNGAEISFQMPIGGETNRLELDLGFAGEKESGVSYAVMGLTGTYQWTFPLADVEGLGWYVGPGANLGFWSVDLDNSDYSDSGINIGIGGVIGIDYVFSGAPVQLSLDSRPMWNLAGADDYGSTLGAALAVRYMF